MYWDSCFVLHWVANIYHKLFVAVIVLRGCDLFPNLKLVILISDLHAFSYTIFFHFEIGSFWRPWVNSNGQNLQTKLLFLELNAILGSSLRSLPSETTEYSGLKYLFTSEKNNVASLVLKLIWCPVLFNLPQVWQAQTLPVLLFFVFKL